MGDLPILTDYICGNINLDYSPNRGYILSNTLLNLKLFACGNKGMVYQLFLVREREFATINLLIFIKIKNMKIVVVQQFNVF